jgi:hypothetical protein
VAIVAGIIIGWVVTTGEHLILQRNYDSIEGEWVEPDHPDAPFLLYVNNTKRATEIEGALRGGSMFSISRNEA